jgi:PhnB protein
MVSFQPQLWVERGAAALEFYQSAFGAVVVHHVGEGDDIVAQLAVDDAAFWIASVDPNMDRHSPRVIGGTTGRTLLVTDTPDILLDRAVEAGARETSAVSLEHGWRLGRIVDPFGHEWEIGAPTDAWPPPSAP